MPSRDIRDQRNAGGRLGRGLPSVTTLAPAARRTARAEAGVLPTGYFANPKRYVGRLTTAQKARVRRTGARLGALTFESTYGFTKAVGGRMTPVRATPRPTPRAPSARPPKPSRPVQMTGESRIAFNVRVATYRRKLTEWTSKYQ